MNESWFVFYGHMMHMTRDEVLCTRYGEMLDMIDCLSIYNGGAEPKRKAKVYTYDEAIALR